MLVAPVRMRVFNLFTLFSHFRFVRIEKDNLAVNIEGLESVGEYDTGACSIGGFSPPVEHCTEYYDIIL